MFSLHRQTRLLFMSTVETETIRKRWCLFLREFTALLWPENHMELGPSC